jgi:hypothetical protein
MSVRSGAVSPPPPVEGAPAGQHAAFQARAPHGLVHQGAGASAAPIRSAPAGRTKDGPRRGVGSEQISAGHAQAAVPRGGSTPCRRSAISRRRGKSPPPKRSQPPLPYCRLRPGLQPPLRPVRCGPRRADGAGAAVRPVDPAMLEAGLVATVAAWEERAHRSALERAGELLARCHTPRTSSFLGMCQSGRGPFVVGREREVPAHD